MDGAQPPGQGWDEAALLRFLQPDETAADLLRRVQHEQLHTGLPFVDRKTLRPGVVVELAGPHGSAKTELLLQIAANCLVFGRNSGTEEEGGQGGGAAGPSGATQDGSGGSTAAAGGGHVVFLDLDGKFDTSRLVQVLYQRVTEALAAPQPGHPHGGPGPPGSSAAGPGPGSASSAELEQLRSAAYSAALARFQLMRVHSSAELLAGLRSLRGLLGGLQAEPRCKLLLLDNVGAFFYQDKSVRALAPEGPPAQQHPHGEQHGWGQGQGGPGPPPKRDPPLTLHKVHAAAAAMLQALCREFRVAAIASKTTSVTLSSGGASAPPPASSSLFGAPAAALPQGPRLQQREFLPLPWQQAVTHRLLLMPTPRQQQRQMGLVQEQPPPQQQQQQQAHGGAGGGLPTEVLAQWQVDAQQGGAGEPLHCFLVRGTSIEPAGPHGWVAEDY